MSKLFSQNRIAMHCFSGQGTVSFRMYPNGVAELIQGWMKGFTAGAGGTSPLILISVIAWLTGALGTARHLAVDLFRGPAGTVFVFVLLYLFYAFQILGYLRRAGRFYTLTAILYPLPMCFFVLVFFGLIAVADASAPQALALSTIFFEQAFATSRRFTTR